MGKRSDRRSHPLIRYCFGNLNLKVGYFQENGLKFNDYFFVHDAVLIPTANKRKNIFFNSSALISLNK